MSKRKVLRGLHTGKVSSNHCIIDDAVGIVQKAKELPEVSKIVPGPIVRVGSGKQRIKFSPISAGIRMTFRGNINQQIFFIYTNNQDAVQRQLSHYWSTH